MVVSRSKALKLFHRRCAFADGMKLVIAGDRVVPRRLALNVTVLQLAAVGSTSLIFRFMLSGAVPGECIPALDECAC